MTEILACFLRGRAKDLSVHTTAWFCRLPFVQHHERKGESKSIDRRLHTGTRRCQSPRCSPCYSLSWQISRPHERSLRILAPSLRVATSPKFVLVPFMLSVVFEGPHTSRTACSSISLQEIFDMKCFGEQDFGKVVRLCYFLSGLVSVLLVPCWPLYYTVDHSHQFRHNCRLQIHMSCEHTV